MRRLIDDLLSLTRIELNEHVPPTGEVMVGDAVREAAAARVAVPRRRFSGASACCDST